jgi:hypothetical protein
MGETKKRKNRGSQRGYRITARGVIGGVQRTRIETEREQSNDGETPKMPLSRYRFTPGHVRPSYRTICTLLSISRPTVSLRESQLKRSVAMGENNGLCYVTILPLLARTDLEFFYSIDFLQFFFAFILQFYIEI